MNKKFFIISTIILAIALVAVLFVAFVLPGLKKPDELTLEPVKIKLDLEFESADDLRWFQIFNVNGEPVNDPQGALVDGVLRLGKDNIYSFTNMTYDLEPNLFVHFRTRSGGNTCGGVGFEKGLPGQSKGIGLENCTDGIFSASIVFNRDHFGDSIFANPPMTGSVPGFEDEWVDAMIWLNESGDQFYYFINNPNDTAQVMYGSVALPEDWQYDRWGIGVSAYYDMDEVSNLPSGYKDIDFIRIGSGTLQSYLNEYIPTYQENKQELDAFLAKPAQAMPELQPQQQGNQQSEEEGMAEEENMPEGENTEGEEMAEEQSQPEEEVTQEEEVPEPFSGVLTWPDPEPILPYLVKLEDIEETCKECENMVYGIDISPFGYVFSVSLGNPPDNGANPNSYVKHWIQLYDRDINKYDLLTYYKTFTRIQSYEAGEPIPFIFNSGSGSESNQMLYKANMLVIAGVYNVGDYFHPAARIVKDTINALPEEGLLTPELVSEPSIDLNNETAAEYFDNAWLGVFESPLTPANSFNGRVNLWVRLKAPAGKVETAIYHPGTQTYLSYSWMDNPPVDEAFAMTGCFFNSERRSPNPYYFEYYQGEMLVRVWVDGQLVNEFSVEG